MNRTEFDRLKIVEQVEYINMELEKGSSLTKLCKEEIKIARSTVGGRFEKAGYKFSKETNRYETFKNSKSDDEKQTTVITNKRDNRQTKVIKDRDDKGQSLVINNNLKENIIDLAENRDEIIEMLNWFKRNDKNMSNVIEVIEQGIKIDLPEEIKTNYRTTFRVNDVVWKRFKQFTEKHSEFTAKNLLSQALIEYMNKHE